MTIQKLLSLPPNIVTHFAELEGRTPPEWFCTCDPAGSKLGSGGGTAHLLLEAWRSQCGNKGKRPKAKGKSKPISTSDTTSAFCLPPSTFSEWLRSSRKLMIHGGGQSRRQPAYAPAGKLLTPMPVWRWATGQRLDQTLLDLQLPGLQQILDAAPPSTAAMVASGDVLLRFAPELPEFPDADIVCIGLWVKPEEARHFGVFFCPKHRPDELAFFLQKPDPDTIRRHSADHLFLVDTGVWLFSERAVNVLLKKCGCNPAKNPAAAPSFYELYAEFGLSLGSAPVKADREIAALTSAVVPLPAGEFYHFGTSRDLIRSYSRLQNLVLDQRQAGSAHSKPHPDIFQQNAVRECPLTPENHGLWIENCHIPASWTLAHDHVLTGVPVNDWKLQLEPGVCLDFVPVTGTGVTVGPCDGTTVKPQNGKTATPAECIRAYGMDDPFRGAIGDARTHWFGRPAPDWFKLRGITLRDAGIAPKTDIQAAPLFPVVETGKTPAGFIRWLFAAKPEKNADFRKLWLESERLSADELGVRADLPRLYAQRRELREATLPLLMKNHARSVFHRLDLLHTAAEFAHGGVALPPSLSDSEPDIMKRVHDRMFRAAVLRMQSQGDAVLASPRTPLESGTATGSVLTPRVAEVAGENGASGLAKRNPPAHSATLSFKAGRASGTLRGIQGGGGRAPLIWQAEEAEAFRLLREAIVAPVAAKTVRPHPNLLEDQIVWGRSPVRLDLAGGWTDTPPYCLLNGGGVVNVAVDLNGQPPLQVFIKRRETPDIVLRSIDLGVEERVVSYAQIADYATVGGPFSIVKAALALAGFHPMFQGATQTEKRKNGRTEEFADAAYPSLKRQLADCGGGLELSLLAAVPKGSGLGTSSILAATALGTIGDACGLGWTEREIMARTLALEQLLTTGGGWQDQAGGILRGIKFVETRPGLLQEPVVRWLPDQPFGPAYANQTILLYYTGITRVAKGILQEIVRGMFLNSAEHLNILGEIGMHARRTCDIVQRGDHAAIARAVAQSWELNQRLDAGTNPPAVQAILSPIRDWLAGAKLLGAGGGGYLLMLAKDAAAAARIRGELTARPPNAKARFIDISLSQTGLQITRS